MIESDGQNILVQRVKNGFIYYYIDRPEGGWSIRSDKGFFVSGNDITDVGRVILSMFGSAQNPKQEGGE